MATPTPFTLRDRIVTSAVAMTTEVGWARVTMGRLAEAAGVSRQTVYNEIGTKDALAEAMILGELDRFLRVVDGAFELHADDITAAIEAAAYDVLVLAQDNALLKAVVSATHGADTELLPLLTTHAGTLLDTAKAVIEERVRAFDLDLPPQRLAPAIDMVVRVVLSHIMQPSGAAQRTAADLAWMARQVLGG
ncbi:TetR family transcriptional regulator [Nocardioides sp. P5_C9_2]